MRRFRFSKKESDNGGSISLNDTESPPDKDAAVSTLETVQNGITFRNQALADTPPAESPVEARVSTEVPAETPVDLREQIDSNVAQILPEEDVRRLRMLPFRIEGNALYVATTEPLNLPGMDELKLLTGLRVRPIMVTEREFARFTSEQFNSAQASKQAIIDMTFQEMEILDQQAIQVASPELEEAPVVDLVNTIVHQAINSGASDVHMEPQFPEMRVRYRINGLLHDVTTVPRQIERSVVARIKLLADMDITERRRPQDGHIGLNLDGRHVDLRISTVLSVNGEKVVIRILDKDTMFIDIEHLGLSDEQMKIIRSFISHPYGMILSTGPTGSGKSTTLYACLQQLDSKAYNIVTVENPVEYQMPGINQISVNPMINMTFATALRTIVRQDPDIIMVGEIRDFETADIAIQAALTGHLVFSTLHTNDAPGAVVRLLDMGIQPFLTTSSVIGVIAQRLLRTICPMCKESYIPPQDETELIRLPADVTELWRGKGCEFCLNTGYKGRTGIFEVFEVDDDVRRLILEQVPSSEIKKLALSKGMQSLSEAGRQKVLQGISTIEEVRRVIYTGKD